MAAFTRRTGIYLAALLGAMIVLMLASGVSWGQPHKKGSRRTERTADAAAGAPHAAGELIVNFKPAVSTRRAGTLESSYGVRVEKDLPELNAVVISAPKMGGRIGSEARERALARLKQDLQRNPLVESVDYNYLRKPSFIPNDPRFGQQYGLKKPGFPRAWNHALGHGVRIGVVDSGIDASHPDLRSKIAARKNFTFFGGPSDTTDQIGHGTHVAGIAAAATDNARGVAGGCPDCKLLVAKSVGRFGGYDSDISQGIVWSANHGAKVINLSLGGPRSSTTLHRAVRYASRKGALVVAAAGNDGTNRRNYPAAYPEALAVAATNSADRRASFSSYGRWVDVAAPGVDILSTYPGGYRKLTGTSMASPEVAGLAGLLAGEGLTETQIRSRILHTAKDLGPAGRDPRYGAGRINAAAATK